MLKRIFVCMLAICLLATVGCTSGVPKADKDGNLVVFSYDEIPIEGFYAKTGQAFSPLYRDGANFNAAHEITSAWQHVTCGLLETNTLFRS